MVGRLDRNRPLPDAQPPRVDDSKTQRALDAFWTSLREVLQVLQPFVQPEKWQELLLYGGAVTYLSPPQFRRNALGRIELRGGATVGFGLLFGTLPVTHRPAIDQYVPATVDGAGSFLLVTVAGEVSIPGGGTGSIVQMCCSFDTEA